MAVARTPRFPRIIGLFDRIFAADWGQRAYAILGWMGGGFVLVFIVPSLLMRDEVALLAQGNAAEAADVGFKALIYASIGLFLLVTFYAAFYYWVFGAAIPRKRAGLGTEYNPVKFAQIAKLLREIEEWKDATDWRKYEIPKHRAAVRDYETWLAAKDPDSFRAWRTYRDQVGV